ncbi:MAG: CPBP family intramembrane metalloprotease [Bacteroidetes bacterium]|nr:CPBP family intramembrane metalloprotease [Bacteroidota bacterium]
MIEETKSQSVLSYKETQKFRMGWSEVSALFVGYIVAQIIVGIIAMGLTMYFGKNILTSAWFMTIAYMVSMLFPIAAFYLLILKPKKISFNFSLKNSNITIYILSFAMMFGMMLVSEFLVSKIPISGPFFGTLYESFSKQMEEISLSPMAMVVMTVILAPILEEIVFRGIILKGMLNKGVNPKKAIFISALVFGVIHGYPWQLVGAFFLGLVLGLVYEKTNSLLIPILLHAFNNGLASIFETNFQVESFSQLFHISEIILLAIGLVIIIITAYFFNKKTSNSTE